MSLSTKSLDEILAKRSVKDRVAKKKKKGHKSGGEPESSTLESVASNQSFEKLLELRNAIGTKTFNTWFADSSFSKESAEIESPCEEGEDESPSPGKKGSRRKNQPQEMSSKRPVRLPLRRGATTKRTFSRDPRFDDLSGEFSETHFKQDYAFLSDLKDQERGAVTKELRKEQDPERRRKLRTLLNRMKQEREAERSKETRRSLEKRVRREESDLVRRGKKAYHLKRSDLRKLELAEKFERLKKEGKLEGFMKKRRKKLVSKERPRIPNRHVKE